MQMWCDRYEMEIFSRHPCGPVVLMRTGKCKQIIFVCDEIQLIMDALESSSSSDEVELTVNSAYALKYDKWRSKEEYQKRV